MPQNRPRTSLLTYSLVLVALLIVGAIGISRFTVTDIDIDDAAPAPDSLSVDERTYYEYVAPRLDRLVEEVDDVVVMVDQKSRDIIELTVHGERIEALTNQILTFAEENGVPERFESAHNLITDGTDTVAYTFEEARTALRTFNFSGMTTLVPKFNEAAVTLHTARDEMLALSGVSAVRDSSVPARGVEIATHAMSDRTHDEETKT